MLRWLKKCYIGEGIKDIDKLRTDISHAPDHKLKTAMADIYLVTLSDHPDHMMEIIPGIMFFQAFFSDICPMIIGAARGKKAAMTLVQNIITDMYKKTGGFDIEKFIESRR